MFCFFFWVSNNTARLKLKSPQITSVCVTSSSSSNNLPLSKPKVQTTFSFYFYCYYHRPTLSRPWTPSSQVTWKSLSSRISFLHRTRKAAHTYRWKWEKPSGSACRERFHWFTSVSNSKTKFKDKNLKLGQSRRPTLILMYCFYLDPNKSCFNSTLRLFFHSVTLCPNLESCGSVFVFFKHIQNKK